MTLFRGLRIIETDAGVIAADAHHVTGVASGDFVSSLATGGGASELAGVFTADAPTGNPAIDGPALNALFTTARAFDFEGGSVSTVMLQGGAYATNVPIDGSDLYVKGPGTGVCQIYAASDWALTTNGGFLYDMQPSTLGVGIPATSTGEIGTAPLSGTGLADVWIQGPGSAATKGEVPCNLSGVHLGNSCTLLNPKVTGFFASVVINQDHEMILGEGSISNSYYGIYYCGPSNSSGDQVFSGGWSIGSCAWACFGLSADKTFGGVEFSIGLHGQSSPFLFYKEHSTTFNDGILVNCIITQLAAEGIGNAIIYAVDHGWVTGNRFLGCDVSTPFAEDQRITTGTLDWQGHAVRAAARAFIDITSASYFGGNFGNPWLTHGNIPATVALIDGLLGNGGGELSGMDFAIDGARAWGIPISSGSGDATVSVRYHDAFCVTRYSAGALSHGDLAMFRSAGAGEPGCQRSTGARPWAGVAITDSADGSCALIAIAGTVDIYAGSNTITAGDAVRADTVHNGQVIGPSSKTWDPPSVADASTTTTTVTVPGALVGDPSPRAQFSNALPAGVTLTAAVTAADTVTVTLSNASGGAVDLASGTLSVGLNTNIVGWAMTAPDGTSHFVPVQLARGLTI